MKKKIRAIIVDDELFCRQNLKNLLVEYCPAIEVVGTAASADLARSLINQLSPDVVFLDVNMPNETGFDLLKTYQGKRTFEVIFTTAYNHFAIKAIKADALDYILKPIDIEELEQSCNKLINKLAEKEEALAAEERDRKPANKDDDSVEKITLPHLGGFTLVETKNIVFLAADNVYTTIHLDVNPKSIVVSMSLKDFEDMLPEPQFVRVHKSYIVNLDFVQEYIYRDNGSILKLRDQSEITVSRRKVAYLQDCLSRFRRIVF